MATVAAWFGLVIAGLTAMGLVVRLVVGVFVKAFEVKALHTRLLTVAEIVEREFTPNGGASIKDKIDAAERHSAHAVGVLAEHTAADAEQFGYVHDRFHVDDGRWALVTSLLGDIWKRLGGEDRPIELPMYDRRPPTLDGSNDDS